MNSYELLLKAGDHTIVLVPKFSSSDSRVTLQRELADVCRDRPSFSLRVLGDGVYGIGKKKAVYIEPSPALKELHGVALEQVKKLGCSVESWQGVGFHYVPKIIPKSWRTRPRAGEWLAVTGVEFIRCATGRDPGEHIVLWPCT